MRGEYLRANAQYQLLASSLSYKIIYNPKSPAPNPINNDTKKLRHALDNDPQYGYLFYVSLNRVRLIKFYFSHDPVSYSTCQTFRTNRDKHSFGIFHFSQNDWIPAYSAQTGLPGNVRGTF